MELQNSNIGSAISGPTRPLSTVMCASQLSSKSFLFFMCRHEESQFALFYFVC